MFLIYVNDLNNASSILDPMFADDTDRFYSHKNINQFFTKDDEELEKIGDSFKANKLSLNNKENYVHAFSFFIKIPSMMIYL